MFSREEASTTYQVLNEGHLEHRANTDRYLPDLIRISKVNMLCVGGRAGGAGGGVELFNYSSHSDTEIFTARPESHSLRITSYSNTYKRFFNIGLHKDDEKIM